MGKGENMNIPLKGLDNLPKGGGGKKKRNGWGLHGQVPPSPWEPRAPPTTNKKSQHTTSRA